MRGVIFKLLEDVVIDQHGRDTWEALVATTGVEGLYVDQEDYPDLEFEALLTAAGTALSMDRNAVLRWFGIQSTPLLAQRYPALFADQTDARAFVSGVNDVIHAAVRAQYPGIQCPHFRLFETSDRALMLDYRSDRRMCALAEGFVLGASAYFGQEVEFSHETCVEYGGHACVMRIQWPPAMKPARNSAPYPRSVSI